MRDKIFLSDKAMVTFKENPPKVLILTNPGLLLEESKENLINRIRFSMGNKCEDVERYIVERMLDLAARSMIGDLVTKKNEDFRYPGGFCTNLTEFAGMSIHLFFPPNEESVKDEETTLKLFLKLPFFEVVEEKPNEVYLQYVK